MSNELIQIENSLSLEKGAPKQIKLLPLGLVKSQKGDFLVDGESYSSILKRFKDRRLDIPVDYEHQTLLNVQAPAAGWIKEISLKSDGIYANVEWTLKAEDYLKNKEYRYLSPVVSVRTQDRKALLLHSVALTNTPAIDGMTAVVNADKAKIEPPKADEQSAAENPEKFIRGLKDMLQLPDIALLSDIENRISELLKNQVALKLEVDTMQFEAHKLHVEETVTHALKTGKLLPYQRDWAFRSAMSDLSDFTLWLKGAPQVVPMGELDIETVTLKDAGSRTRANELMGLSVDDVKRYGSKS
ncbi:phage protease [Desulfitobacterium sp.]|uniref:phage protease n=1 Tax=Desulfitobacterium sp. TaxID=49981 RepID=UPI002C2F7E17|nr:phage protease [Desulfitobacterium sp.]HVJ50050.1 phage protease [Desulfitobacterium sp.]